MTPLPPASLRLLRTLFAIFLIATVSLFTRANAQVNLKSVVTTEHVRAELMAHAPDGADPGKTVWLGLQITHQPEWHTYWKNPGDSGLPTTLTWTLPAGVTAGDIRWPLPKKISIGTLVNYGYEGTVLLPVPLTVTPDFRPGVLGHDIDIKLKAAWLVCHKECIPEEGEFALKLPMRGSTALNGAAFSTALAAQPRPLLAGTGVLPESSARIDGSTLLFTLQGLPVALRGKALSLFPETPEVIDNAATPTQGWNGAVWTARVPLSPQRSASPAVMPMVLAATDGTGLQGVRADIPLQGTWPTVATAAGVSPALAAALRANAASAATTTQTAPVPLSLVAALLGALLGGLLLNLMPCVFPVLALKVLGFAQHAGEAPALRRARRADGWAYTAGVMLSCLVLGALMLGLRWGGEQLGWGFQLQSPAVVAALAVLFTVIGLNLVGLFEFGQVLPSAVASAQAKNPTTNAFLSGVLAVAVASPCTAPFMGASLGLALGLPAWQALVVFGTIGVGLALPYLAASLVPAVARALPRPGAWMATLRRMMAFPMFATVVWLLWVLGQQSGLDGAAALLALLVSLSMVVWAFTLAGRSKAVVATISIAIFLLLTRAIGPNVVQSMPSGATVSADERWQAWEPGRVDQLLASGQPVLVDFTAAWCVTCQYNKKTTLSHPDVLADLDAKKVALLRADWTRRDPAITAALAALGRNGVPVYAFYKPGSAPVVLSEILSVGDVRATVAGL